MTGRRDEALLLLVSLAVGWTIGWIFTGAAVFYAACFALLTAATYLMAGRYRP